MPNTQVYKFEGRLVIPEKKFEYAVFSNKTAYIELLSLSDVLMNIFKNSVSRNVKIEVQIYDMKLGKYMSYFKAEGELLLNKSQGLWDWFVSKSDLGIVLFNNVDSKVLIKIEDLDFSKYTDVEVNKELNSEE